MTSPSQPTSPSVDAEILAFRENLREAWSALAMIRETIETLGPIGALPASEHLPGPTFMHEAEALVAGIRALSAPRVEPVAETTEQIVQRIKEACAQVADRAANRYADNASRGAMAEEIAVSIRALIPPSQPEAGAWGKAAN